MGGASRVETQAPPPIFLRRIGLQTQLAPQKKSVPSYRKYHNTKTVVEGETFDSKFEAKRFCELRAQLNAGAIHSLKIHPRYLLQDKFKDVMGTPHRAIFYEGDFEYFDKISQIKVIEDCKGFETEIYRIKKKLFLKTLSPDSRFIELKKHKRFPFELLRRI